MTYTPTYPQNTVVTDIEGVNEVQTVTVSTVTNGKTLTLEFDGEVTEAIAKNAELATVKAALEGLSNIDQVAVTGSVSTEWTIEFQGSLAQTDVPELIADPEEGTATVETEVEGTSENPLAVQLGTGHADGRGLTSPLENPSPSEARAADGEEYGDS